MKDPAPQNLNSQKPLDESSVEAIERAFQDEIVDEKQAETHNFKPIMYFVLIAFFVIAVSVASLAIFYSGVGRKDDDGKVRLTNSSTFKPVLDSASGKEYIGKVFNITDSPIGKNYSYQLLDNKGDTIVYMYSNSIDLSLAQGLTVSIRGIPDLEESNGIKVINVEELEFK